jgi:hypothetical protein
MFRESIVDQREMDLRSKLRRDQEYGRVGGGGVVHLTTLIATRMVTFKLHVPTLPPVTTTRRMGIDPWHVQLGKV